MLTSREIRRQFIEFFEEKQHRVVDSAPVVTHGDPTLMFINAGMNQFKDVFLGTGVREYTRAVDTQKCIRVSGKHNDLEEVGYDTYHHTFFEMLGNWSFGDYYKREAIDWAWELLTGVWKLDPERLHATVYRTDDEAFEMWKDHLPESRIHRFDEKDNFWEMGATGPCGPCSELHYDRTPDKNGGPLVNADDPRVIEIWNLVFMQSNRLESGELVPLTNTHVDTGMGFERICAVLQGVDSNYDTDVFQPIIGKIAAASGRQYQSEGNDEDSVAMRVMADHIRTLTFAIADGAIPGNTGRGYVLRRVLRRASRYARNIGFTQPFLFTLVDELVKTMSDVFPEIAEQQSTIERIVKAEEESFLLTLENGLKRIEEMIATEGEISGQNAFLLYDTFGFPFDLTALIARERGVKVDEAGFEKHMEAQKERSRSAQKVHVQTVEEQLDVESQFTGYTKTEQTSRVVYAQENVVVLDETPFYVESGGQISDTGELEIDGKTYKVEDTRKNGNAILHVCAEDVEPDVVGAEARALVNAVRRRDIQANHTVTHLLHEALRRVLGDHVKQSGSVVRNDLLRFDFPHFEKVTDAQLGDIENMVNEKIREFVPVSTAELDIEEAREVPNVKMFFGDKYGDRVRVVTVDPDFSVEFCGGTHVNNTSEIGLFKFVSEGSVAAGIRRVEAVTGVGTQALVANLQQHIVNQEQQQEDLLKEIQQLKKALAEAEVAGQTGDVAALAQQAQEVQGIKVVAHQVQGLDMNQLKQLGDELRNALGEKGVGLLVTENEGKVQIACVSTDGIKQLAPAGKLVGLAARKVGGGGGGKPHMATAGGKNAAAIPELIAEFPNIVAEFVAE